MSEVQGAEAVPASLWCYECDAEVHQSPLDGNQETVCPLCGSGFIEDLRTADVRPAHRRRRAAARGTGNPHGNPLHVSLQFLNQLDANQLGQLAPVFQNFMHGRQAQGEGSNTANTQATDGGSEAVGFSNSSNAGQANELSQRSISDAEASMGSNQLGIVSQASADSRQHSEEGINIVEEVPVARRENAGLPPSDNADTVPISLGDLQNFQLEFDLDDEWDSMSDDDDGDNDDDDDEEWEELAEGETGEEEAEEVGGADEAEESREVEAEAGEEAGDGGETEGGNAADVRAEEGGGGGNQRRPGRFVANFQLPRDALAEGNIATTLQQLLQSLEIRVDGNRGIIMVGDTGGNYVGNPGDYLDARGLDAFLNHLAANDNSSRGPPPASKAVVEKLSVVAVRTEDIQNGSAQCAICKEIGEEGQKLTQLPCSHLYHADCIMPWLSARNSCPLCRFELPTDDEDYETQRRSREETSRLGTREEGIEEQAETAGIDESRSRNRNGPQGSLTEASEALQHHEAGRGGDSGEATASPTMHECGSLIGDSSSMDVNAETADHGGDVLGQSGDGDREHDEVDISPRQVHANSGSRSARAEIEGAEISEGAGDEPLQDVDASGAGEDALDSRVVGSASTIQPLADRGQARGARQPSPRGVLGFVRLAAQLAGLLFGLYVGRRYGEAVLRNRSSGDESVVEDTDGATGEERHVRRRRFWLF